MMGEYVWLWAALLAVGLLVVALVPLWIRWLGGSRA